MDQDLLEKAIEAARSRFPDGYWDRLPAGEKAEAIQAENTAYKPR